MAAQTAQDWIADLNDMLLTYSPNYRDITTFAAANGAIGGEFLTDVTDDQIETETGWVARYDQGTLAWILLV